MSTEGTGKHYLTEISSSDAKFDSHKSSSEEIARLLRIPSPDGSRGFKSGSKFVSFDKYAIRIYACGSWLRFVKVDGKLKLVEAKFCKAPMCPTCQWRRSLKWRAKFLELLPEIQKNYPSHKWLFLTLTIRNCDLYDLKGTLRHLNASFRRLYQLKQFPMDGLVKSVEVTRAWDCYDGSNYLGRHGTTWIVRWEYQHKRVLRLEPTNEVHPHLHVTGLVPSSYFSTGYIKHEQWVQMWQQSLRVDYPPVVNIKAVKPKKGARLLPDPREFKNNPIAADETGIAQAICETLKYTVKEQDLIGSYCQDEQVNSTWLKEITQQLYKSRKVEYRGILKDTGKQLEAAVNKSNLVKATEEEEEDNSIPTETLEFQWKSAIKKYVLSAVYDPRDFLIEYPR